MLLSVNMPPEEPLLLIKRPTRSVVYIILVESGASEQLHLPQDPSLTMQAIENNPYMWAVWMVWLGRG